MRKVEQGLMALFITAMLMIAVSIYFIIDSNLTINMHNDIVILITTCVALAIYITLRTLNINPLDDISKHF